MDQRGFPESLPEFQAAFPSDEACAEYLEKLRWPDGFSCPKCGVVSEPFRFANRPGVLRCRSCRADVSLKAGSIMQDTRTPLSKWFWGAYLVTTQTPGMSALQFQRQLDIGRYETAFQMLHKLRAGMVRPDRDQIGAEWPVEVDECLVGGKTKGEGRGVHHKSTVVGAVEIRARTLENTIKNEVTKASGKKGKRRSVYAGRLRLRVVSGVASVADALADPVAYLSGRGSEELTGFVKENVAPGATVRTDGWIGYAGLPALGFKHQPLVLGGDPAKTDAHLPLIHIVFSNLKTWLHGTHHGVSPQHLQAYLNEFVFRFNRRFYPMSAFHSVLGLGATATSPTYRELYDGAWEHPA